MRQYLIRIHGIRVLFRWSSRKERIWIEPDHADLMAADMQDVAAFFVRIGEFCESWREKHPGWKVADIALGEDDQE